MSRAALVIGIIIGFALAATTGFAAGFPATPNGSDLDRFPVMEKQELTTKMQAVLGLKPVALMMDARAFNHQRKDGSWPMEHIHAGTIVLVDGDGRVRYKADCSNRLVMERDMRYVSPGYWADHTDAVVIKPAPTSEPRLRAPFRWIGGIIKAVFEEPLNWFFTTD